MKNKFSLSVIVSVMLLATLSVGCTHKDRVEKILPENNPTFSFSGKWLEGNKITIPQGEFGEFLFTVDGKTEELKDFALRYYDKSIIDINSEAKYTALSVGKTQLKLVQKTNPMVSADISVEVTHSDVVAESVVSPQEITLNVPETFNLSEQISFLPLNARIKTALFSSENTDIAVVDEKGVITAEGAGETFIIVKSSDEASTASVKIKLVVTDSAPAEGDVDRSKWTVTLSPAVKGLPTDAAFTNVVESLIDGDNKSCLSICKPGEAFNGGSTDKDGEIYLVINLGGKQKFNSFRLRHRNKQEQLRLFEFDIYGSNNGTDFNLIKNGIVSHSDALKDEIEISEKLLEGDAFVSYRFVKVVYKKYKLGSGKSIQVAEFGLSYKK